MDIVQSGYRGGDKSKNACQEMSNVWSRDFSIRVRAASASVRTSSHETNSSDRVEICYRLKVSARYSGVVHHSPKRRLV